MKNKTKAYAALDATTPLEPYVLDRRALGPYDVDIAIDYCGVCHSDLHQARNEWGGAVYPLVPGHEIVGHIKEIGSSVSKFKIGDRVGVGVIVDSCRRCSSCQENLEQYCEKGASFTYNSTEQDKKTPTYGGYCESIVTTEDFVLRIPENLSLAATAPLLCAGITTYSPLRHWHVGPGQKVGIVGLGGLGHMGVKFAHAFGAKTYVITTSPHKKQDALQLGAEGILVSKDPADMAQHANSFDLILSTISASYKLEAYLSLLKRDGKLITVGLPSQALELDLFDVVHGRKTVAGSMIGGIKETQEMLDFCGEKNIAAEIELIPIQEINTAYQRMIKGDVHYRFVIDMASLGKE
ncbi:MAG: NAD(P)-dependent alcohol dehydrogenase [Chthoniobacterales bacterium]|nr:NAD(P)-dependent alcohol dehydrogenase [Chthoniobacterales bacterium]